MELDERGRNIYELNEGWKGWEEGEGKGVVTAAPLDAYHDEPILLASLLDLSKIVHLVRFSSFDSVHLKDSRSMLSVSFTYSSSFEFYKRRFFYLNSGSRVTE